MSLPLIIDKNTTLLILGSYPSVMSLRKKEYYANPSNDFWRIISFVIDFDIEWKWYDDKIKIILKHKIGLWDVYKEADREGSKDVAIKGFIPNDFSVLKNHNVKNILCAGKEAYRSFEKLKVGIPFHYLPSTSAANRITSKEEKAEIIKKFL
ncbi:DNA-deoxyinosine glycosylase [archaeon]|jgi:hypoxanthine-DNA glycosylase|nr:DNA-deoxyinosine glycosylase [archaeon]MBT4351811.1 DNA-deoxyinosine glycosylase [archaeon]MBT4647705.1 DNA-deoxyinosine glycosylase [archaeon]MBT6822676.1 DNA-deoxyinosine glycosylase [archaeon]MBT7392419.1 DNA-deoxyinosine glycosylase [archaeon]